MSGPDRPQLPSFADRLGIQGSAEVGRVGDDAILASGQVWVWHVADHPERRRST